MERETNINNLKRLCKVGRLQLTHDEKTIVGTYGIAGCIALAIAAVDSNGVVHRIVAYNPYYDETLTENIEKKIKEYLQSIEKITKLNAIICSMEGFKDFPKLNDREQKILNKVNDIFAFYKEKDQNFNIFFHRSWYIKISPQGEFEYASSKMLEIYNQLNEMELEEEIKTHNEEKSNNSFKR